ncbi:MAG: ATP-binding protein [Lentisphaeria bacterium]|nr:ATP-binding protein [Lentisphaeria bacterium]
MPKNKVSIQDGNFERVLAVAFAPVVALTELIKNASDACMTPDDKIAIYIDKQSQKIRIIDNGYGFSHKDIESLFVVGFSSKMRDGNTVSRINEPFAGSKGLGILTAFNLCDKLEIRTFSQDDKKTYHIVWEKGTGEIRWKEIQEQRLGSEFILHGVAAETFQLILLKEELTKLYFSSIKSCVDKKNLPRIELFNGGILDQSAPQIKIEELYKKNRKNSKGFFVAKASFKYKANKLSLSYEDNIKGLFNFRDEEIDLTDLSSVLAFLRYHKISGLNLKEEVENFDSKTVIDDFDGVYYIWRGTKDSIKDYPYGVRIYINNYGLYNYLNSEFDWLQHSEISQNKKATNYKLKNTYGYVSFSQYNEDTSSLKISNERNDFTETLAKKKFLFIMRKFVSAIFSTIDMNIKNFDDSGAIIFKKKANAKRRVTLGNPLKANELICTNLSMEEINADFPSSVTMNGDGNIVFSQIGHQKLQFEHNGEIISIDIDVEDNTPSFELKKASITILEKNAFDLRSLIKATSLKNLSIGDIKISSNGLKILNGATLSSDNLPGQYVVFYKFSDEIAKTIQVTIKQIHYKETDKIQKLFPYQCSKYPKISDVIASISESYTNHPTLCMIAMRPLVEFALKAFILEFYSKPESDAIFAKEKNNRSFGVIDNLTSLFQRIRNKKLAIAPSILSKYEKTLIDCSGHITKAYDKLDLNAYVHNPNTHASPNEVMQFMKKLQPFLNFVIEALNTKL